MASKPNSKCSNKRPAPNVLGRGENKKSLVTTKNEGCSSLPNISSGNAKQNVVSETTNVLATELGEFVYPSSQQIIENIGQPSVISSTVSNESAINQKGNQGPLFSESTYYLNKSRTKWISIGLCANQHFEPVIRLMGKGQCLSLSEPEWKNIVNSKQLILNSFVGDLSTPAKFLISGVSCSSMWIENTRKVFKMDRGSEVFYLAYDSLDELWKLTELVSVRLDALKSLEYHTYYDNMIEVVSGMQGDIKSNVWAACNTGPSEQSCIAQELLVYGMDKILLDIDLYTLLRMC